MLLSDLISEAFKSKAQKRLFAACAHGADLQSCKGASRKKWKRLHGEFARKTRGRLPERVDEARILNIDRWWITPEGEIMPVRLTHADAIMDFFGDMEVEDLKQEFVKEYLDQYGADEDDESVVDWNDFETWLQDKMKARGFVDLIAQRNDLYVRDDYGNLPFKQQKAIQKLARQFQLNIKSDIYR